ncbi:hypothetical protein AgCh_000488 [Apium graveolens]
MGQCGKRFYSNEPMRDFRKKRVKTGSRLQQWLIAAAAMAHCGSRGCSLGSFLTAGDDTSKWPSPSGDFAFGFRRLENNNLFLLAIWVDKIPDKTIVWYANGANPAPKRSKIELTTNGKFNLNIPNGQSIWKAENVANGVTCASLLDTGNFVLASENSSKYMWESFRYPSDTMLPNQVLDVGGVLSSRLTKISYSEGHFRLQLRPADTNNSMNSGYRVVFNETGYIKVVKRNGVAVNLTLGNIASTKVFYFNATLDFDGISTQYAHPKNPNNGIWERSWFSVWYEPKDICTSLSGDLGDGACGFNSIWAVDVEGRPTFVKDVTCWKKKLPLSYGRLDRNTYGKVLVKIPKVDGSSGNKISRNPNGTKKDQSTVILVVSVL